MSSPCLPQELVDTVIDHVHADHAALAACATVSKSWLRSARYHLFASISLSSLSHSRIPPNVLCARLYAVLKADPDIIPFIRSLQILDGGSSRSAHWIIEESTLPPLLKLLTDLRQLEFGALDSTSTLQIKSLPFPWQNALCTVLKLPTMTYFRIQHSIFPNLTLLDTILSSCHNLKGLSLCSVTVDEDHSHPSRSHSFSLPVPLLISDDGAPRPQLLHEHPFFADNDSIPPHELQSGSTFSNSDTMYPRGVATPTPYLEALTLDHINFTYLGYWLFSSPQSPPISFRHLRELRISHSADPLVVEQILLSTGSSLEYLHLKPGFWEVYSFDLRKNENLKSLRLTLEEPSTALLWCTTLLASLLPHDRSGCIAPELTHISLEFWPKLTSSSFSASPSTSTSTSFHNSPDRSPHHISTSNLPSPSLLSSTASSSSSSSASSSLSSASSPSSSSSLISSATSMSSSSSHASSSASSSFPNSHFPSTPPRSRSPSPRFFSSSPTSSSYQGRRLSNSQPTWSYLSSILSSILLPSTHDNTGYQLSSAKKKEKQVDIGLFAKSSDPEFIRIKELMLSGLEVGYGVDDDNHHNSNGQKDSVDNNESTTTTTTTDDDGDGVFCGNGKGKGRGEEVGAVRVYQLGLKGQKSFGRLCGPMLRSFESPCH